MNLLPLITFFMALIALMLALYSVYLQLQELKRTLENERELMQYKLDIADIHLAHAQHLRTLYEAFAALQRPGTCPHRFVTIKRKKP